MRSRHVLVLRVAGCGPSIVAVDRQYRSPAYSGRRRLAGTAMGRQPWRGGCRAGHGPCGLRFDQRGSGGRRRLVHRCLPGVESATCSGVGDDCCLAKRRLQMSNPSPSLPGLRTRFAHGSTSMNKRFSMNRRDLMKLASLAMLPMTSEAVMASSQSEPSSLKSQVFTVSRPGLNRDVPPGKESLMWVANSATLIYGEQDAVLVDTFLTVEQSSGLADAIVARGKTLKAIYVTHAHGDHFFGIKVLQDRFPGAQALATPAVVARMKLQVTPEKLNGRWRKVFPNQI